MSPESYQDPDHPWNGAEWQTGQPCIERGCTRPAGTAWSPYWCQPCNVERMDRISAGFEKVKQAMQRREDAYDQE